MHTIASPVPLESSIFPGVTFTLAPLNKIRRAARDLTIIQEIFDYEDLLREFDSLLPLGYAEALDLIAEITAKKSNPDLSDLDREGLAADLASATAHLAEIESAESSETKNRRNALMIRARLIDDSRIKPAVILSGLRSICGLEIDGKPATTETFVSCGPNELIDEIYLAIGAANKNAESARLSRAGKSEG